MRRRALVLALLWLPVMLAGCASAPVRPDRLGHGDEDAVRQYLARLITFEMRNSSTPGLSIALVDDQRVVWSGGFGFADLERKVSASGQTLYRVGSISKLFTDTAAMQLVEQRRLDIDQPLQTYLPGFSIRQRHAATALITARQLMTHHAGLPRDLIKGFQTTDPAPIASVIRDIRGSYAAYAPGETFYYSNLGITLLGNVIEQVSGAPFADHVRRSLLLPLGMKDSSFEQGESSSLLMARGYHGQVFKAEPPMRDLPAGGLNASVDDLGRFMSMMFAQGMAGERRILQADTVHEMLRPQNRNVPLDLNFEVGLGWMLSTLGRSTLQGAGTVAHHAGAIGMFRSQMYLLPEHKLGVVVLANSDTAGQVVDRVATQALAAQLEVKTGIRQPPFEGVAASGQPAPQATVAAMVGDYTTIAGPVRIFADGSRLSADLAGRTFKLVPRTDGLFTIGYTLLGLLPVNLGGLSDVGLSVRRVAGHDLLVAQVGAQQMLVGDRVLPPADLGKWRNRLGDYRISNLDGDRRFVERIRLTQQRGFLLLEMTMSDAPGKTDRLLLMPQSDTEAVLLGVLNDGGEPVSIEMVDGQEHLVASGYRATRIRAEAEPAGR